MSEEVIEKKVIVQEGELKKEAPQEHKKELSPNEPHDKSKEVLADPQQGDEEDPEIINWKKFREKRLEERKAKQDAEKRATEKAKEAEALKMALEALIEEPRAKVNEVYKEYSDEEPNQEVIQAAVRKALNEEKVRQKAEETKNWPTKIAKEHKDFAQVCTAENLDYLEYHYPEVTAPYSMLPESFEKWDSIYRAVKKFIPNAPTERDKRLMDKNQHKPQSSSIQSVAADGRQGKSGVLSDSQKKSNWERMEKIRKGLI